jgi:hypothetical protein
VRLLDGNLDRDGDGDLLQLHEPLAADLDRLPLDMDCNPVADLVLCVVVGRQIQPQLDGPVKNRLGDRMMELTLGGRREPKDAVARKTGGCDDPADLRALVGQRSCLVEEYRIDRVHLLKGPSVFDKDTLVSADRKRAEHCQRSGHADASAEVAVKHRHGADWAHGGHAERTHGQGGNHRPVSQPFSLML